MKKMGKTAKRILVICVCVTLAAAILGGSLYLTWLYGAGALNQHDHVAYAETRELLDFRAPFEADYIWIKENGVAVWAAFSTDVYLEEDADLATLDIACDTYYWLWVNGEEIVWEGGLKRGVTPEDGFYDHVIIQGKFKAGRNNVSILVRHLGDDGFSHKDAGHGYLVVEGSIGGKPFATDGSWKARKFAYQYSAWDFWDNLNYRLSERGSRIDGTDYCEFWQEEEAQGWDDAVVLDEAKAVRLAGKSYLNPLPPKTVDDVIYFDPAGTSKTTKRTTLTFALDVNTQFCPYFEFESDKEGRKITYYTENKTLNYKNTYTAKQGENAFVDFAWISGEKLIVTLDKGITLKRVGYRPTGYGATQVEAFRCDDAALTVLWQKAANTLALTMRDSYMDCPDRERAQWIGDAVIESGMSFYSLSPESAALFRKAILTTYGWVHANGTIQTVVPSGTMAYELPQQNLAFLVGCVEYVKYSGDETVVPMILSMAQGYLPLWKMKNGLVVHRKGSWDWCDWGKNADVTVLENAWYYYALSEISILAPEGGELASFCRERMDSIRQAFPAFYTAKGIASGRKPDDRANALAILAGLYRPKDSAAIADTLYKVRNASPYMEKYVEQALCELGRTDLAVARAKERYADMITDECTTLWEFWDKGRGTTNHAWAGGTLYVLSRYVGGVCPTSNGFGTFVVRPNTDVVGAFRMALHPTQEVAVTVEAQVLAGNRRKIIVTCTTTGGTLVICGKRCEFNGTAVESEQNEERTFPLGIGVNVLIFEQ